MQDTGSFKAVEELYANHYQWLRHWLQAKLGPANSHAADLAQDTFIRLFSNSQLSELNEPRAFLTTVASRVLSNHWRRAQLETAYLQALENQPQDVAISPEEQQILFETLVEIDQALSELPMVVKKAFFMAQLDGVKYADIASELDVSVSTVKRYLVRASARCYFALELSE